MEAITNYLRNCKRKRFFATPSDISNEVDISQRTVTRVLSQMNDSQNEFTVERWSRNTWEFVRNGK